MSQLRADVFVDGGSALHRTTTHPHETVVRMHHHRHRRSKLLLAARKISLFPNTKRALDHVGTRNGRESLVAVWLDSTNPLLLRLKAMAVDPFVEVKGGTPA